MMRVCIFALVIIVSLALLNVYKPSDVIYCLMCTGKDNTRVEMAKRSVMNFLDQDYPNKKLVIINQGEHSIQANNQRNITEMFVSTALNIGQMRNISLQHVPLHGIFTTFDDDDIRSYDYLSTLKMKMDDNRVDVVCISERTECNLNNGFVWNTHLSSGLLNSLMARKHTQIKYRELPTLEDVHIIQDYIHLRYKLYIFRNDPLMYIRTVHDQNTSPYANSQKTKLITRNESMHFYEYGVSKEVRQYVLRLLSIGHLEPR